jgi:hypothetical protein
MNRFSMTKLLLASFLAFQLSFNSTPVLAKTKSGYKKASRKISSFKDEISEQEKLITADLNKIILSVSASTDFSKTERAINNALEKIENIKEKNPNSSVAKLYYEVTRHIPLFKGFLYRMRSIVEKSDFSYIIAIAALRKYKQTNQFRAKYMDALFDYLTEPNPGKSIAGQNGIFTSISELQDWFSKKVQKQLVKSVKSVKKLLASNPLETPYFIFKSELMIGKYIADNIKHDSDKSKVVLGTHLLGSIASLESGLSYLNWISAYNLDSLTAFGNTLLARSYKGKRALLKRGWSLNNKNSRIVSAAEVAMLLKSKKHYGPESKEHGSFLTLRKASRLAKSKKYLIASIDSSIRYHSSMVELAKTVDNPAQLIADPELYVKAMDVQQSIANSGVRYNIGEMLEESLAIAQSKEAQTIEDKFLKRSYSINPHVLFDGSITDLRSLFPSKFDESKPELSKNAPGLFKKLFKKQTKKKYLQTFKWNYNYAKMLGWNDSTFGGLIVKGKGNDTEAEFLIRLTSIAALPQVPFVGQFLATYISY